MGSWGVVFSVGGATLVYCWVITLPIHLTVINYKIFWKGYKYRNLTMYCSVSNSITIILGTPSVLALSKLLEF